ncbi:MAG: DUF1080 domain-containing protein [Rikenellaceae bacterium]|jgi:hypothetical protein|nr:DUF1080 domain-containing protein [Rikenellaceae bacterium]
MKTISKTLCLAALAIASVAVAANPPATSDPDEGYVYVFDGKTLDGWAYDPVYWRVEDGCLVGEVTPATLLKRNTFCYKKDFVLKDFELNVEFRVSESGNSGVSYRNELVDTLSYALIGYQADIDGRNRYTGQNYEERGRQFLALRGQATVIFPEYVSPTHKQVSDADTPNDALAKFIKPGEWNQYYIVARGNHLLHYVNGVLMADVTDNDPANRRSSGILGVQVHTGPPMKIEYRNFKVKVL